MRVAPTWVRRPVTLAVVLGAAYALTRLPLVVLLVVPAATLGLVLLGRWRLLRLLAFFVVYLAVECAGLVLALALWVASGFGWRLRSPWFQRAHYAVLQGVLAVVVGAATHLFHLRVVDDEVSWSPLDDGVPGSTNAMVVLSRHAGPGDSLLLVHTLMRRDHLRRPRIVLKNLLQLDPLLDVYLNRLPNAFLTPGRSDLAAQIGGLAAGMGEEDALLIFPEGGNFTPGRRRQAIKRLRDKGLHRRAAQAEQMRHVLAPRDAGLAAALAAAPQADVVLVAHTGLEHLSGVADLWRGLPMDSVVRMRWEFVPAAEVPRQREEQADWLFTRWAQIDAWVASYAEEPIQHSGDGRHC